MSPELLERDAVLAAAAVVVDGVRTGRSAALFVVGEAGLGKSAVLEHARGLADADVTVGVAVGSSMESTLPFGAAVQLLDSMGGGDALDWQGALDAPDARSAAFYSVQRWFEHLDRPRVLLTVDDLHWADPDSLALLSFLCRRLPRGVGMLGALRPFPAGAETVALALAHDGLAALERLAPLTERAAGELLATRLGYPLDEAAAGRAWELCSGNPLLLEQVARAVDRGEDVPSIPRTGSAITEELLLARFAGLPAPGIRCAQAAAVLGTRFRTDVALEMARLDGEDADAALEALGRTGLVREVVGGGVEFAHPLFRQALYDDVAAPVRARMHEQASVLLRARGLDAEAAEHVLRAEPAADPEATEFLERVGGSALRAGALETAITLLEGAVHRAGDRASSSLLLDFADALASGGRPSEAIAVYERVLKWPDLATLTRAHALRLQARSFHFIGRHEPAAPRFEQAADLAEEADPDFATYTLISHAFWSWFALGPAKALEAAARARAIAERCDEVVRRRADTAWALCALETGDASGLDLAAAAAHAVEADPTAVEVEARAPWGVPMAYASAAKYVERLADSDHFFAIALRAAHEAGSPQDEAGLAVGYADALVRHLRLDEAVVVIDRCAALSDLAPVAEPFSDVARAMVCLFLGRLEESEVWVARAEPVVAALGAWSASLWLAYTRGWRALVEARIEDACALYEQIESMTEQAGIGEPCVVPWAAHAITAYVTSGRVDDARRVIGWLERSAERLPCRWPRIATATGRARLAEADGDHDAADELFGRALALHDGIELPLERFQTLLEYGKFLRRAGHVRRARPLLADALELADAAGADWLAGQARDELRVAGGRRRRRGQEPGRLTPQERRVAALAAAGARNRDIADQLYVSTSTVETHLENVFAKLGIHSRRELPAREGAFVDVPADEPKE